MKTNEIREIIADKNLIAYCGLYCGSYDDFALEMTNNKSQTIKRK
jgi:hypothetical protein